MLFSPGTSQTIGDLRVLNKIKYSQTKEVAATKFVLSSFQVWGLTAIISTQNFSPESSAILWIGNVNRAGEAFIEYYPSVVFI